MLGAIARSPAALAASGVWGYAEATRFFIVPDVLIGWVALHGVRPGAWSAFAATAGAVLGGAAVHRDAAAQQARLTEIPGVSEAMLDDAAERFAQQGWAAVMRARAPSWLHRPLDDHIRAVLRRTSPQVWDVARTTNGDTRGGPASPRRTCR